MEIKTHHFFTLTSTQDWAKDNLLTFDQSCLHAISADVQTAGKGRYKREWVSPQGNLYLTYVFFQTSLNNVGNLPQVLAISACQVFKKHGLTLRLKWPNDLVIDKKKMGGILTEVQEVDQSWAVLLGIGINLNTKIDLEREVTSYLQESGVQIDLELFKQELTSRFLDNLALFLEDGFDAFYPTYLQMIIHQQGDLLSFHKHHEKIQGVFDGIDSQGALRLQLPHGETQVFQSGEVLD